MVGDGIRAALRDVVKSGLEPFQDLILITDGEDQGSLPLEAAKAAGERRVRLLAIGLGDETAGGRIPLPKRPAGRPVVVLGEGGIPALTGAVEDSPESAQPSGPRFLEYDGKEVRTRLNADLLREMANCTPGGRYFNVGTGTLDPGAVHREIATSAEKRGFELPAAPQYEEGFQKFLALALAVLATEMVLPERRRTG